MDAESRNGVRVNGEPYAQIGLRHGDVLEVGHLRYAFVEPGRAFQLPPELTPLASAPLASPPTRTGLWVGIGIASVALLAAAIFLILRNRADAEIAQRLRVQRAEKLRATLVLQRGGRPHALVKGERGEEEHRACGRGREDARRWKAISAGSR